MDAQSTFDSIRTKALYNLNSYDAYARQFFTIDGSDKWIISANANALNFYSPYVGADVLSATKEGPVRFRDVPTFGAWTPYHTGNFDPNSKHPVNGTVNQNATGGEVRPWGAVQAADRSVYQFAAPTRVGVFDTKDGLLWEYNQTSKVFSVLGSEVWTKGNFNPKQLSADIYKFTNQISLDSVYDPNSQQSRIQMVRTNQHPSVFADFITFRDTSNISATGQGFGGVSTQICANNIVGAADTSQWNILSTLKVMEAGAGQHCATYAQTFRYANTPAFTGCFEHRDFVRNPTVGNVAFELDMFGAGPCNGGQHVALDIVYGGAEVYADGDQVVSEAISISPLHGQGSWVPGQTNGFETSQHTGQAIMLTAINVKGNTVTGLDLSGLDPNFSYQGSKTRGVRHSNGLVDTWDNGGSFGFLNDKMLIAMPNGGLAGGAAMPTNTVAKIKVNIAGYGDAYIPIIA